MKGLPPHFALVLLCSLLISIVSCDKEQNSASIDHDHLDSPSELQQRWTDGDDDMDKSPYAVSSMQSAHDNLVLDDQAVDFPIDTTHVYLEHIVTSESQYEALVQTHNNDVIFDHPLWDYTSMSEFIPTFEGAGDTAGIAFPHTFYVVDEYPTADATNVKEYLHIPEDGQAPDYYTTESSLEDYITRVEEESFSITGSSGGNDDDDIFEKASCWDPTGTITVDETERNIAVNNLGPTGVCGTEVIVYRVFRNQSTFTNCNGDFTISCFRKAGNWKIKFKTQDQLKVVNAFGLARSFNRPGGRTRTPWIHNFDWWSSEWMSATIVNGAATYDQLRAQYNLASPWHSFQLLNVRTAFGTNTSDDDNSNRHSPWWGTNRIKLWSDIGTLGYKGTDGLQRTLAHELTHSAHYKAGQSHMIFSTKLMTESYADFVEWLWCERFYPHQSDVWGANKQLETWSDMSDGYSAVFIDMVDSEINANQCIEVGNFSRCPEYPLDFAENMTPWSIQNAVFAEQEISHVGDYLVATYPNFPNIFSHSNLCNDYSDIED